MPVAYWSPLKEKVPLAAVKVAVVLASAPLSVMAQVEVPLQPPPLQPEKVVPEGVAVRVTATPSSKVAEHVPAEAAQELIPAGLEETEPLPTTVTVMVCSCVKVAVSASGPVSVTSQVAVPVQAPLKPSKTLPPL